MLCYTRFRIEQSKRISLFWTDFKLKSTGWCLSSAARGENWWWTDACSEKHILKRHNKQGAIDHFAYIQWGHLKSECVPISVNRKVTRWHNRGVKITPDQLLNFWSDAMVLVKMLFSFCKPNHQNELIYKAIVLRINVSTCLYDGFHSQRYVRRTYLKISLGHYYRSQIRPANRGEGKRDRERGGIFLKR